MRDIHRRIRIDRRQSGLWRRADGSLLPTTEEASITDVWASGRREALSEALQRDQKKKVKHTRRSSGGREVEIVIGLPKISMRSVFAKMRRIRLGRRRVFVTVVVFLVIVGLVATKGSYGTHPSTNKKTGAQSAVGSATANITNDVTPTFTTLLPDGKTIHDFGGWSRVSPPASDPAFGYSDMLADVHITVSEQRLPASFAGNPYVKIQELAKQYGTAQEMHVGSAIAYMAVPPKGSGQTVIVVKNSLLLFLRSSAAVDDKDWANYIVSLI